MAMTKSSSEKMQLCKKKLQKRGLETAVGSQMTIPSGERKEQKHKGGAKRSAFRDNELSYKAKEKKVGLPCTYERISIGSSSST